MPESIHFLDLGSCNFTASPTESGLRVHPDDDPDVEGDADDVGMDDSCGSVVVRVLPWAMEAGEGLPSELGVLRKATKASLKRTSLGSLHPVAASKRFAALTADSARPLD